MKQPIFQRLIFKPIEAWIVFLLVFFLIVLTILLGAAVRHYTLGGTRLGALGPIVYSVASFPATIRYVFTHETDRRAAMRAPSPRFKNQRGFLFRETSHSNTNLGYLLLNRYDADLGYSVSELWDLDMQVFVHRWSFKGLDELWDHSTLRSFSNFKIDSSQDRFRNGHALLTESGRLIAHGFDSPLISVDQCSKLEILQQQSIYHHSIEEDNSGNLWVPSRFEPKITKLGSHLFEEDALTLVSLRGEIIFKKSVVDIFKENGLAAMIYGRGMGEDDDPIHLNDIEPVTKTGRFWKAGDLFLSMRNISTVALYRPSENKIIWYRQGPWLHQHDVNIIDDSRISVFNNNSFRRGGVGVVDGSNNLLVYDFSTDAISSPYDDAFRSLEIRTVEEGRGRLELNGDAFVEESTFGRVLQFDRKGAVRWQFVNRASDGNIYRLNWSRLISRDLGDKVSQRLKRVSCR